MIRVTVDVNCPEGQAIGVKEAIAMDLEKYGDTRVIDVAVLPDRPPEQIKIGEYKTKGR